MHDIRCAKRAFTLVEIMVTAAVLSLAAVLIYETFFIMADVFNYYYDYLDAAPWADEKIWQVQDYIRNFGPDAVISTEGNMTSNGKRYDWYLSYGLADATEKLQLYDIELTLFLQRGSARERLLRSAYALYEYEEE